MDMIRKYKTEDMPELIRIFELNTPKFFDKKEIADFKKYLETEGDNYFVIESDNKIAGGTGIQISDDGKTGRITWIFFHPHYSGKGFGRLSVEHCLALFRKNPSLEKVTASTSQFAYKFFEKFNFKHISTEKDYWGKGLHLYTMELKLQ